MRLLRDPTRKRPCVQKSEAIMALSSGPSMIRKGWAAGLLQVGSLG